MHRQQRVTALQLRGWRRAIGLAALTVLSSACITVDALPTGPPFTGGATRTPAPEVPTQAATTPPTAPPLPTVAPTPTPVAATPVSTPAQTPVASFSFDPLSEEALLLSMLVPADDVDPLAETSGVDVGTEADDLPAFAEQGGLRRAAQTIGVGTDYTVFDFRYQFPTADAAAAFLDAEADNLGETHAGAVETELPIQLGDDTRFYTSHTEIFVIQDSFNYLIRVENVVAKVWVGGDPDFIDAEKSLAIATDAWGRMTIVFDPSEVEGL